MSNKWLETTLDRFLNFNDGLADLYDMLVLCVCLLNHMSCSSERQTSRQSLNTCSLGSVSLCLTCGSMYVINLKRFTLFSLLLHACFAFIGAAFRLADTLTIWVNKSSRWRFGLIGLFYKLLWVPIPENLLSAVALFGDIAYSLWAINSKCRRRNLKIPA